MVAELVLILHDSALRLLAGRTGKGSLVFGVDRLIGLTTESGFGFGPRQLRPRGWPWPPTGDITIRSAIRIKPSFHSETDANHSSPLTPQHLSTRLQSEV